LPENEGVIITQISPDSKAMQAGLQVGDVIKEINHREIKTQKDYEDALTAAESSKEISMFVRRQNAGFIVIKIRR